MPERAADEYTSRQRREASNALISTIHETFIMALLNSVGQYLNYTIPIHYYN